ncbi:MAG: transposase, partial [Deltaproteobacteria bacterium]|nr:transposase [Deltaproteobacteria bacterium]
MCDGHDHPLHFHITAGQTHDSTVVDTLLMGADRALHDEDGVAMPWPRALAGDKGYRYHWIDQHLVGLGIKPVIPCKSTGPLTAAQVKSWVLRRSRDSLSNQQAVPSIGHVLVLRLQSIMALEPEQRVLQR